MPAISRFNRTRVGKSRRQLLQLGRTFSPRRKAEEIECFQRFVDLLDDEEYRTYRREKRRKTKTGRLFPVDQKKLTKLFQEATDFYRRSELARSVSGFLKDYCHPTFEYCIQIATARSQKLEKEGKEPLDILEELLSDLGSQAGFLEGLAFRSIQLEKDFQEQRGRVKELESIV